MQQRTILRRALMWAGVGMALVGFYAALSQVWLTRAAPMSHELANSVAPRLAAATRAGTVAPDRPMTVTFTLQSRNQAALQQFATAVATPHSRLYHHFLSPAQFAQVFGPDPAEVRRVELFAQQQGMRVTAVQSGGMFITITGRASQMQRAFGVQIGEYHDSSGGSFFANDRPLSLPSALAPGVISVSGLDNATQRSNHAVGPRALPRLVPHVGPHDATCPATTGTYGLTPPQLKTTYGFGSQTGSGQRIALVEFDGYLNSDIAAYTTCFDPGVNSATVVKPRLVDLSSAMAAGDGAVEVDLDIEVALGMAPGLANVDVYEAPNTNQGLIDLLAAIANDDLDATVSDSWGACEADTSYPVAASEEMAFLQMAAQGQGVYIAAGDTGAYTCLSGFNTFHGRVVNADDPATDPYVTAVGGTTLTLNATTAGYMGETVWNNSSQGANNGTGGGYSMFWAAPTWQVNAKAVTTPGGVADPTAARVIPDVAADADPQTGYAIYCTAGSICAGLNGWFDIGGTSAAAPLWASLGALTNQQAGGSLPGGTRIGLITPALYQLYGSDTGATGATGITMGSATYYDYSAQVNGSTPPASGQVVFHDVTQGSNTFPSTQGFPAGFSAQTGFDAVSGLGTMQAQSTTQFLVGQIRFTAPRLYMVAKGTNNGYWIANYFLNTGDNNTLPNAGLASQWTSLPGQTFQGAPGIADNGLATASLGATTGMVYIAGIGTDGTVRFGSWNPAQMLFSGWSSVPGTTCQGDMSAAFAQSTFFVACMTPSGGVVINAYNPQNNTWGGWATIGGGLTSPPTMSTDGQQLLIVAQAPTGKGDQSDWYTYYTPGTAAQTPWYRFMTTCQVTPAVAFAGASAGDYMLACVASDTGTMWQNQLATANNSLSYWSNLGSPAGVKLRNGTSIALDTLDSPDVVFFTGQGTDNASYVQLVTTNPYFSGITGWQMASSPNIFSSSAATDYFGV